MSVPIIHSKYIHTNKRPKNDALLMQYLFVSYSYRDSCNTLLLQPCIFFLRKTKVCVIIIISDGSGKTRNMTFGFWKSTMDKSALRYKMKFFCAILSDAQSITNHHPLPISHMPLCKCIDPTFIQKDLGERQLYFTFLSHPPSPKK